jgi:hypothetical protein
MSSWNRWNGGILPAVRRLSILAVLAMAAALSSATASGQTPRPSLRLVDDSPVTFRGAGFHAREHVRLVVVGGERAVKSFDAGVGGGFVVRVRGVDANACTGFSATAIGDHGSRASYKRAPGMCPNPVQP